MPITEEEDQPAAKPVKRQKETKPDPKQELLNAAIKLVDSKAPYYPRLLLKIHHIYDNRYFRLNYHDTEKSNYITHSFFVEIIDGKKVKFSWQESLCNDNMWKNHEEVRE